MRHVGETSSAASLGVPFLWISRVSASGVVSEALCTNTKLDEAAWSIDRTLQ